MQSSFPSIDISRRVSEPELQKELRWEIIVVSYDAFKRKLGVLKEVNQLQEEIEMHDGGNFG